MFSPYFLLVRKLIFAFIRTYMWFFFSVPLGYFSLPLFLANIIRIEKSDKCCDILHQNWLHTTQLPIKSFRTFQYNLRVQWHHFCQFSLLKIKPPFSPLPLKIKTKEIWTKLYKTDKNSLLKTLLCIFVCLLPLILTFSASNK